MHDEAERAASRLAIELILVIREFTMTCMCPLHCTPLRPPTKCPSRCRPGWQISIRVGKAYTLKLTVSLLTLPLDFRHKVCASPALKPLQPSTLHNTNEQRAKSNHLRRRFVSQDLGIPLLLDLPARPEPPPLQPWRRRRPRKGAGSRSGHWLLGGRPQG